MEPSANFSGEEGSEGERKQANAGFRSRPCSLSRLCLSSGTNEATVVDGYDIKVI